MPNKELATASIPAAPQQPGESDADDELRGISEIARFRREPERRTHYLCEHGMLPAYQIGRRWHMRKSTYRAFVAKLEAAAIARATEPA